MAAPHPSSSSIGSGPKQTHTNNPTKYNTTQTLPVPVEHKSKLNKQPHRPRIAAVIFDLDGTLLDTESVSTNAINTVLSKLLPHSHLTSTTKPSKSRNLRIDWSLKSRIIGLKDVDWASIIIKALRISDQITPACLIKGWLSNMKANITSVQEMPGAYNLVQLLHDNGITMAIATSSSADAVKSKRVKHEGMFQRFATIVTGDDEEIKHGKPAPDIYLLAAKRIGVPPKHCLVFEDSPYGIKSASAAGMYSIAVPDPRMDKARFKDADKIIKSLKHFVLTDWDFVKGTVNNN